MDYSIKIDTDHCSGCSICWSCCPYDALKPQTDGEKATLDIERCQLCGLCHSACPSGAIEIDYDASLKTREVETLLITCRGSSPSKIDIVGDFEMLRLPCVGRTPIELLIKALSRDQRVVIIPCEEDYCRFERGSRALINKVNILRRLIEGLNVETGDFITLQRSALRVKIEEDKCIGCLRCVDACPYDAIRLEGLRAKLIEENCKGCGRCAAVCAAMVISMEDPEYNRIPSRLPTLPKEVLIFTCRWAEYEALDLPHQDIIELPCAGTLDPLHVLYAFREGFRGVLVIGCERCKLEGDKNNDDIEEKIAEMRKLLTQAGIDGERISLQRTSPKNIGQFNQVIEDFTKRVAQLGPLKRERGKEKKE